MRGILCSMIEGSGFLQNTWMQWILCSMAKSIPHECSGFHAAWLNAVSCMHYEEMEPYWMRGILCSMIECSGFLQDDWMQWSLCSMAKSIPNECSGFHAAWLNAVDSMQRGPMDLDWTQCIPCSVAKMIPIECSGYYAAWCNGFWLNAVDSMHRGTIDPNWMQWNRCSVTECSGFHAAW